MVNVNIKDGDGTGKKAHVIQKNNDVGVVTLTEPLHDKSVEVTPLLNSTSGADMTQSVSFGGTAEGIHDGTDSVLWTATAIQGTWDFADTTTPSAGTKCFSLTTGIKNDEASFADATQTNMTNFVAVTGKIRLDTYDAANTDIKLQFYNNAVIVGGNIKLKNYINTGLLGVYQNFVIPKADFGIVTQIVDQINVRVSKVKGVSPTFRMDTFQIENTGAPSVFTFQPDFGQKVRLNALKLAMADNVTATSSYNALLGVTALTNGINVSIQSNSDTVFNGLFTRLIDFLNIPNSEFQTEVGAADTWLTINFPLTEPILLDGDKEDKVSVIINDDLSGLLYFQTFVSLTEDI